MRILHVIHRYPPAIGGGEFWCAGLARWQAAQGHRVRVATLRAVDDDELWGEPIWGPDLDDVQPRAVAVGRHDLQDGVEVLRSRAAGPLYAAARLLSRAGLEGLSWGQSPEFHGVLLHEARRADVIHGYWLGGPHAVAAWLAARVARRPFVLTPFFHEGFAHHETRVAHALLRGADRVIALTEFEASALEARGARPNRVVHGSNAIDAPRPDPAARTRVRAELGTPPDAALLCYVGRKAPNKGLDVLLRAFERIQAPDRLLVVAGPSTAWYDRLLAEARGGRIIDLPALSEGAKFDLLAAADVLVLPSRHESFGTVFLEAWAVGTPVIGADVNAVRQVIGDAGLTFRPDDADDLAARIGSLLGSPSLRRALAERGRRELARHTWDRLGSMIMAAYEAARPAAEAEVAR